MMLTPSPETLEREERDAAYRRDYERWAEEDRRKRDNLLMGIATVALMAMIFIGVWVRL